MKRSCAPLSLQASCWCSAWLRPVADRRHPHHQHQQHALDRKALEQLFQEGCRRIGVDLKLVSLPSERSLIAANLGEVDGEGLRIAGLGQPAPPTPTSCRCPNASCGSASWPSRGTPPSTLDNGWDSLEPYRIAFINGWKMFEANATGARVVQGWTSPSRSSACSTTAASTCVRTRADGEQLVRSLGMPSIAPVLAAAARTRPLPLPPPPPSGAGAAAGAGDPGPQGRRQPTTASCRRSTRTRS